MDNEGTITSPESPEIYRKWFKTKEKSGFLTIKDALAIGRVSVDIGEVGEKLKSSTLVWVNAVELAVYLKAVEAGTFAQLYGTGDTVGTFTYYGGANTKKGTVSRILKVEPLKPDMKSFYWKAGIFEARVSATGAFMPEMDKPVSMNLIKVSLLETKEILYRLDLAINSYAARHEDWANSFSKAKKK